MSATTAAAPTANSSPNTKSPLPGKDEKSWTAEIHKGPEYNGALPVGDVVPDPLNRKEHDAGKLAELVASIKSEGLQQPVVVRPCPRYPSAYASQEVGRKVFHVWSDSETHLDLYRTTDKRDADRVAAIYRSGHGWQLIAGERRWRAHVLGEIPTIAARIDRGANDLSAVKKQIVENLLREGLNPMEEARQMKRLSDLGESQKEIGKVFGGRSQPVVANTINLLKLPLTVQDMISSGRLSSAHGQELVRFAHQPTVCACIARMAADHDYDAKSLRQQPLPFANQLIDEGIAVGILLDQGNSWETRPTYKLPPALAKDPDFIRSGSYVYYILPSDPALDKWKAEKEKQDAKRAEKMQAAAEKEAKLAPERRRELEKSRARKAALLRGREKALAALAKLKAPTSRELAILAVEAVAGGYSAKRIEEVAQLVGVKLPKGLVPNQGGQGLREAAIMAKMSPADVAKLAVGVILHKDVDDMCKNPRGFSPDSAKIYGVEDES